MFIESGNKKIYYDVKGSGEESLLFIHGWMGSSDVWHKQVEHFAKSMRVITIDLTGYGRSSKPDEVSYDFNTWTDDINLVIEQLKLDKPIMAGWSMGGALAISYAAQFPDKVSKLVVVDSSPLLIGQMDDFAYASSPEMIKQLCDALESDFSQMSKMFVDIMLPEQGCESIKEQVYTITQQTRKEIAIESLLNAGSNDLRTKLVNLKQPTLIIHGSEDKVCSLGAGEYLADQIPHATLSVFPEAGHIPFMTKDLEFNRCLENFINAD